VSSLSRIVGATAIAFFGCATTSQAQNAGTNPPPLAATVLQQLKSYPREWQKFLAEQRNRQSVASHEFVGVAAGWKVLRHWLPGGASGSNPILLTNGTVLLHQSCTSKWFSLKPDIFGNYDTGIWTAIASMPSTYTPRFFASAVLPDGRLIVEGGEYLGVGFNSNGRPICKATSSDDGAIYDPVANRWRSVGTPPEWTSIGDASSTLLNDGTYLLSNALTKDVATLDESTMDWTTYPSSADKFDINDEENWTLLPDGDVITVDAFVHQHGCAPQSELYSVLGGEWFDAGSTAVQLADCASKTATYEGPTQIMQPTGIVVAFGATTSTTEQNYPAHTASYSPAASQWSQGPDIPQIDSVSYTMVDAPAAILPNGSVLVAASPAAWKSSSSYPAPTHFFVFDGSTFTQISDIADWKKLASYQINLLVLPTGEILCVETDFKRIQILPAQGVPQAAWAPVVKTISSKTLKAGVTYTINGTQLSGLTQGAGMGDDEQAYTNFPLVRVVNSSTRHVFYARTTFTSNSVQPNNPSKATFVLPGNVEAGASKLYVVANGIPSQPVSVTIQ